MEDFIKTRGSNNIENAEKMHTLITYEAKKSSNLSEAHRKSINVHRKEQSEPAETDIKEQKINERAEQEKEMKRFRYDVIKFGMSGLDKQNFLQAKMALAISLGAKPPKNKRKNYKKLIEERKILAAQKAKKLKFASGFIASSKSLMKYKKNASSNSNDSRKGKKSNERKGKKSNGILDVYGKVDKKKGKKGKAYKKGNKKR